MFGQQWFESALRLLLLPPAFIQTTLFSFFTRGNNDRPWRAAEPTIFSQKNTLTHFIGKFWRFAQFFEPDRRVFPLA
jgi:hypothetical protein